MKPLIFISNVLFILIMLSIINKLAALALFPIENFASEDKECKDCPSGIIQSIEDGDDPDTIASDACARDEKAKFAQSLMEDEYGDLPDVDGVLQESELDEVSNLFYGMAKHGRSGHLLRVTSEPIYGSETMNDDDGWVKRTSVQGQLGIHKEDQFSADSSFSREYALWKCSKINACIGTIYARDGSKFALYKNFTNPANNTKDPVIGSNAEDTTFNTKGPSQSGNTANKLVFEKGGEGEFDLHIQDSPERIANERIASNMKPGISDWHCCGANSKKTAEDESIMRLEENNSAVRWTDFSKTIAGCSKSNTNNGNKWKCTAEARSV